MAESALGRRVFAVALWAVSGFVAYQAWENSKLTSESMARAKDHACDLDSSCIVLDDRARVGKANIIQHRYEYNTTHGMMTVTCQRELFLFGEWQCTPEKGRLVSDPL